MNSTNFALITALYDTKGADLYNEIYFPIINYELVNQFNNQVDIAKYYDISDLQTLIQNDFGINIPLVVLKQSIRAIIKNKDEISLSEYENGKQYKILKAWDITIKESIDVRSKDIQSRFQELEQIFTFYLETEGLSSEKSFMDLYSDNTEEILAFLSGGNIKHIINEQYVSIARFLDWLAEYDNELYNIANDVYWGSIIAGFLKRENVDLNIKASDAVEYYFDSSLVLAALDLASSDNVCYAKELLNLIIKSGNIPKVHTITVKEVTYILNSVEKEQGPRPFSAIEEAYYRRELTPSKILQIKNNLVSLIEEKGFIVTKEPNFDIDRIEQEYKNRSSVKELEKYRGGSNNSIRDIHDVYLRDYILKKRKGIVSLEKVNSYFVSLNSDLITYFNSRYDDKVCLLLHPSRIATDLWIHSSCSTLIKKNGLTELMSRCFALNNLDIRRKLRLFSKYYKETSKDYTPEAYTAVYKALVNRSTKVLQEFDVLSSNEQEEKNINEKLNQSCIEGILRLAIEEENNSKKKNAELQKQIEILSEAKGVVEQGLALSEKWNDENEQKIKRLQDELKRRDKIEMLDTEISNLNKKWHAMDKERNDSVCMFTYYATIVLETILILLLIFSLLGLLYSYFETGIRKYIIEFLGSSTIFALISTLRGNIGTFYIFSPIIKYNEKRFEQIKYWDTQNPEYRDLKQNIKKLNLEKQELIEKKII